MIALPFIGHNAKGATRWIEFGGFTLQPSEFMKPALIVPGRLDVRRGPEGRGRARRLHRLRPLRPLRGPAADPARRRPDHADHRRLRGRLLDGRACRSAGSSAWPGVGRWPALSATLFPVPPRGQRACDRFLSPDKADTHQIDKAAEAIAAGGLFGARPGRGRAEAPRARRSTPTSPIRSAAEEYGLIFSLLLIAPVRLRGGARPLQGHEAAATPSSRSPPAGLFVLVGQQAFINVAVNLNMIPTKGMTLPFISYGGSSMLAMGLTWAWRWRSPAAGPAPTPSREGSRQGRRLRVRPCARSPSSPPAAPAATCSPPRRWPRR